MHCDPISTPEDRFHPTIELNMNVQAEVRKKHYKTSCFHRMDYNTFNYLLLNDWDSIISGNNLDNIVSNPYVV